MFFLLRILRKLRLLKYFNLSAINDDGFVIPVLGGTGMELLDEQEKWMRHILTRFLFQFRDKIFLDAGVNVGQTLLKVMALNRDQPYIGFEPNPSCVNYIYQLVAHNNFSTVVIFPLAISDKEGIVDLQLYDSRLTDSSASIVQGFRKQSVSSVHRVPTMSITNLPLDRAVGFVKIDVEGGELEVLKSVEKILSQDRPLVVCEVLPVYSRENLFRIERQNEIEKILERNRFGLVRLNSQGTGDFISRFGIHANIEQSNYIFYPLERHDEIKRVLYEK
ncbi:MAG: FkbM family methyltransferase [Flammeovirgaceae bacterium]|nr:FkbM family methyltransferase [Flammeovirgaceae bacterium]